MQVGKAAISLDRRNRLIFFDKKGGGLNRIDDYGGDSMIMKATSRKFAFVLKLKI